jgi:hypothetical protein
MRGEDERSGSLFCYVDLEARVATNHPLRTIRVIVNEALAALAGEFSAPYSPLGLCLSLNLAALDAALVGASCFRYAGRKAGSREWKILRTNVRP